jgi:hypothetical protein
MRRPWPALGRSATESINLLLITTHHHNLTTSPLCTVSSTLHSTFLFTLGFTDFKTVVSALHWYNVTWQIRTQFESLDDCLTVLHRSITLVDLQLDAQNSYLFTYNTFIKILYMFRPLLCSSSGGLSRNCIYAASGIVTVCRWLSCAPVKLFAPEFYI